MKHVGVWTICFLLLGLAWTSETRARQQKLLRKHFGLWAGYYQMLSDELKFAEADFTKTAAFGLNYRYSLNRTFDIVGQARFSTRGDTISGIDYDLFNTFWGFGVRINGKGNTRPFFQPLFYYMVTENLAAENFLQGIRVRPTTSAFSAGFGVSGGIEWQVKKAVSVLFEATYIGISDAGSIDDLSGIGFSLELNLNSK